MSRLSRPASSPNPRTQRQRGGVLLEALVAILVLGIAVTGMLGVVVRTLAETQTGVRRAQAVRLIEDFAERVRSRPDAVQVLPDYVRPWDRSPTPVKDCKLAAGCNPSELVLWDADGWKSVVERTLPGGEATIFLSAAETTPGERRQLGVMVAWQNNEREKGAATTYDDPFAMDPTAASAVICPPRRICHLVYVQP
jgi:type IV pilus assembly protein PilV